MNIVPIVIIVALTLGQPVMPEQTDTGKVEPVKVEQTAQFNLYLGLGLAVIGLLQAFAMAAVMGWISSRKEKRDAERVIAAAEAAAKIKSAEKQEEWRRQDEVAARAASTAKLLIESQQAAVVRQDEVAHKVAIAATATQGAADLLAKAQQETITRTDEVARIAAENDSRVQAQLTELHEQGRSIHGLVDGEMTTARTNERNSLKLLLISLRSTLNLSKQLGVALEGDEEEEIKRTEVRISELDSILKERHETQQKINAAAAAANSLQRRATDSANVAAVTMAVSAATTQKALERIEDNTAQTAVNTAAFAAEKTQETATAKKRAN